MKNIKFSDLACCPFCDSKQFYEKQYAKGHIIFRMRFDGEETPNDTMHDNLEYSYSGRAYCDDCNQYLGNYITNAIGRKAYERYKHKTQTEKR